MLNEIVITDEDISRAGLLMGGYDFTDDERSHVIKTMETNDIQACPGSGKTSTLVAKLLVLSRKLPNNQAGICVLSHTNAARDEITKHLAKYGANLLHYPHFIGTIQQFVDQFIAIPAMVKIFRIRPSIIDDEVFGVVAKGYSRRTKKLQYVLDRRRDTDEILYGLRYSFDDIQKICVYANGKEKDLPFGISTPSYAETLYLKTKITNEGYIGFHDAFSLANWYLMSHPQISNIISARFPLVFIDEMQDTDSFQSQIISKAFLDHLCIVQKLGDRNQTIYSGRSDDSTSGWQPHDPLPISHSYRLSSSIASLTQNVCQEPQDLTGYDQRPNRRHTIFLFENDKINEVLPQFAELLIEEGLYIGKFKAIGYVKKLRQEDDHLTISSYWPEFSTTIKKTTYQKSLRAYFDMARTELATTGNCGSALNYLIAGLVQILRHEGVKQENGKWFSNQSFLTTLKRREKDYSDLRMQLLAWINILKDGDEVPFEIIDSQIASLVSFLPEGITNSSTRSFLDSHLGAVPPTSGEPSGNPENIYLHRFAEGLIKIEIDTIHGVKGQTHTATLVLDTYWFDYHLKMLLPYLKGERESKVGIRNQRRLNLAYVAMTRPTDLLCLAMKREHVTDKDIETLTEKGWNISVL